MEKIKIYSIMVTIILLILGFYFLFNYHCQQCALNGSNGVLKSIVNKINEMNTPIRLNVSGVNLVCGIER